jgi:two-component system NtrC family sensor kinase
MLGLGRPGRGTRPPSPRALEHVSIIESEIRRLDEVVQGSSSSRRPEDLRLQPVKVNAFRRNPADHRDRGDEEQREGHSRRARVAAAVNGDSAMLRQAFLNLAINACQAMPNGGRCAHECARVAQPGRGSCRRTPGLAFAPEHLSKIFNLYFTTKERGTGIGLSMVYRIIQMHDGEVEVQSTPGRGTTFRVLLPRASGI